VLANRLTTDGETTVCLLEAGEPPDDRRIGIPAAFTRLFKTELDWDYYTTPQHAMGGRKLYWPRGKTLGGSSAINAMIYVRGHPADYDAWAAAGNEGWGWDDMRPRFKRAEDHVRGPSAAFGADGPLSVTDIVSPSPLSEAFVEACVAHGLPRRETFNAGTQRGAALYEVTQRNGERCSVADAYLTPVLDRPTLTVETGARATRIEFDGRGATGVTYERDGETATATADEVVLCAGAIESPHLLLCSGVGPEDHLREHDIEVVADRPGVGRNLQDHLTVPVVYESATDATLDDADTLWNYVRYRLLGRGPLTSNVAEGGAFVRTDEGLDCPDLQLLFGPAYLLDHGLEVGDQPSLSVGPTLLAPESRGRITLDSADPRDPPRIDPAYLSEEADLDRLISGIELARDVFDTAPLASEQVGELHPGPDVTDRDALAAYVRERGQTLYHPVGTCKMGDGERAVVDDRLRVRGVEGLRVVDASVMPRIVRGNTNAPTVAIAERAADFLHG
jgi:choline dehydrogenase